MLRNYCAAATLCAGLVVFSAAPAFAAGEILLTHAKALAGNVTPGDTPGYPIHLTLPGVYQFAGNLQPTAGSIAIAVTSPNATIDLNGFTLHGSNVAFHGIAGGVDNVTIRGGTITGFKFDGIHGTGDNWRIERMRVETNGRDGIVCGFLCLVKGAVVARNQIGIQISTGIVLGSAIGNNASFGIVGSFTGLGNSNLLGNNGVDFDTSPGVGPLHPNVCGDCP